MQIQDIFNNFTSAVGDVQYFKSLTVLVAKAELQRLHEWKSAAEADSSMPVLLSMQNWRFREATTGQSLLYHFRDTNVKDRLAAVSKHTNRQLQWHLTECYELFEAFLKEAYAWSGHQDPSSWPLRDFGEETWGEVEGHGYPWFLTLAKIKRGAPTSILRYFSKLMPSVQAVEEDNKLGVNLLVAVTFVASVRHKIVHAGGVVSDHGKFAAEVMKKLGMSGKGSDKHVEFISQLLLLQEDGQIYLMKVPDDGSPKQLQVTYDIFDEYVRYLLSYAHHLSKHLAAFYAQEFQMSPPMRGANGASETEMN